MCMRKHGCIPVRTAEERCLVTAVLLTFSVDDGIAETAATAGMHNGEPWKSHLRPVLDLVPWDAA